VRATGYKAGETVVLTTRVGGEEGAAVHALMAGGADIGVVVSSQGARTRVVARVAGSLTRSFSLPEDLLEPLAETFGGDGGGHARAGTAELASDDVAAVEGEVIARIEDAVGMQFGTFS
jgi:phosphoesterase RecJ-like protein